jgi:glycerophosphoryl diester phosphodiesterase
MGTEKEGVLPLITAHTGCEDSPVNTVASMYRGVRSGADAVEIDVRSTAEGAVILMHDDFVVNLQGRRIPLKKLRLEELLELDKNGQIHHPHPEMRITRLEEALEAAGSFRSIVNLDLKDDRSIPALCRAVERYDLLERTIVTGCDAARAGKVKAECPDIQVLLNVGAAGAAAAGEAVLLGREDAPDSICRGAVGACCGGINIEFTMCRKGLVDYARRRYLPVSVWTVDREEDMRTMIALGVSSITTCQPARLRQVLTTMAFVLTFIRDTK